MNKDAIANIIYNELDYMYCNNCRYSEEIESDCDFCYRKYNNWGISKKESERIAQMLIRGDADE